MLLQLGTIKDICSLEYSSLSTHIYTIVVLFIACIGALSPIILHLIKQKITSKNRNLLEHYFFQLIDYTINCKIDQIDFKDAFKNKIFKQLLKFKFELLSENAKRIINQDKAQLITSIEESLYFIINNTRDELKERLRSMFTYNEQTVIVDGIEVKVGEYVEMKFLKQWDMINYECMLTHFKYIAQSNIYDNNHERIAACLNVLTAEIEIINITVEKGLKEINGLFKNINI